VNAGQQHERSKEEKAKAPKPALNLGTEEVGLSTLLLARCKPKVGFSSFFVKNGGINHVFKAEM
jgi:hypothetical protein